MPSYPLLANAVRALANQDDGAVRRDGVGFNGGDTKFGNRLAQVPDEAWSPEMALEAWQMLGKYREQLQRIGIDFSKVPEPIVSEKSKAIARGVKAVDIRNNHVVVFIPYGEPLYPKVPLTAVWNRDIKGWVVAKEKYGAVLGWAEKNKVPVSDRAKEFLGKVPPIENAKWNGEVVLEKGQLVIRFDYNVEILDSVRSLSQRHYNAEDKTWSTPKENVMAVKELAAKHQLFLTEDVKRLHGEEIKPCPKIGVLHDKFAITFNYQSNMVSEIRQMPGSVWSPDERVWVIPVESVQEVRDFVTKHEVEISKDAELLFIEADTVAEIIESSQAHDADIDIKGFGDEQYKLFPFQRAGVAYAMQAMGYEHHEGEWKQNTPTTGGVLVGDEMGLGKAQVHGTKVLTPKGWTNIENLSVGDEVIGSNGHATKVTGVFPRGEMDVFTVGFNDGSTLDVSGDHLWAVQSVQNGYRKPDEWQVRDTNYLAENLIDGAGNSKWKIPLVQPVYFEGNEPLPIDPYLLGVLLGDGCLGGASISVTSADEFIIEEVKKRIPEGMGMTKHGEYDYRLVSPRAGLPNELGRTLSKLGLRLGSGEKFIPEMYLRSTPENRLALLRGLMDTDGFAGKDGTNEFVSISKDLADGVTELVQSLGGVVRRSTKQPTKNGADYGQLAYRVNIKLMDCPFFMPRKANDWVKPTKYPPNRNIKSITPNGRGQVTCIAVEAQDHLYVTEHYLVTHNTPQGLAIVKAANAFPAVIVVPASLKLNWEREAKRWIKGVKVAVLGGTTGEVPEAEIYVINYDVLTHWVDKFPHIKALVLDESHYIKNGSAQRSKACVRLSDKVVEGGIRVCLSGTPIVNQPTEIITQLRVINRLDEFGGATKFRNTYGSASGRSLAALNRKLRSTCYVRRRKADVLTELPPKRWSQVFVEGNAKVMKEYREAEADIVNYLADLAREIALESGATDKEAQNEAWRKALKARAAEQLVAISTLKQLAAKAKMEAAREWIDNFVDGDKKLVVFGWHRSVVNEIADNFSNGVKIQGGLTPEKRQEAVDAFQNDDKQKVIACNIKAAGVGLTLTAASDVLFLEQGWTPSDMEQAVDRCHRIGQQDSVTGWLMLCANTIDEDIAVLIDNKRSIVDRAIDGSNDDEEEARSIVGDLLVSLAERGLNR